MNDQVDDSAKKAETNTSGGNSKFKLMMILIGFMMILSISSTVVTVILFMKQGTAQTAAVETENTAAPETANATQNIEGKKPYFYQFMPTFTVNIPSKGRVKFLQVQVQVMSFDKETINKIEEFAPLIKNDLISLFSQQEFDALILPSGKDMLRKKALKRIKSIMMEHTGEDKVEQVLFTSFITQ